MNSAEAVNGDIAMYEPRGAASWRDPFSMYAALRDRDPVHHVERGDFYVLSRFEHVFAAARDTSTFSSASGLTFTYDDRRKAGIDGFAPIVMMDPPDHTAFRRLVSRGFTPRAVATIEADVRAFVGSRLAALVESGGGDVIEALFKPLPSFVVAHYLGVPSEDRPLFDRWTDAIVAANAQGDALDAADAVGELAGYFSRLIDRRSEAPGEDMVSALASTADGASVLEILGFAFTMVAGGNDTVTGMLGGAAELLTSNRAERDRLLADPSLIPTATEEFLRLTSPVQGLARTATRDVAIDGTVIPEGRKVMLLYAAANRDEREFGPTASACDVGRDNRRILTFSSGAHFCLGASVARLQARVVLEELLARCPEFTVDATAGAFAPGPFVRRYQSLPMTC